MSDVTETNEAAGEVVAVERGPIGGITVSGDGSRLVVTNFGDDSISVIDAASGNITATVSGVEEPFAIATAGRGRAYVATAGAAVDAIAVIDIATAEQVATYPVALHIADLVADPAGHRVYAARTGPSGVDVLTVDADRGPVSSVEVSTGAATTAGCLRISPDGRNLYLAVHGPDGDAVVVLAATGADLNIVGSVAVEATIRDLAVSPDSATVFVAGCGPDGGTVHVVDARTNTVTGRFEAPASISQVLLSCDGTQAYLLSSEGLAVADTGTRQLLEIIAVGAAPSCAVQSPDGSQLFVAGYDGTVVAAPVDAGVAAIGLSDSFALDDIVNRLLDLEPAV